MKVQPSTKLQLNRDQGKHSTPNETTTESDPDSPKPAKTMYPLNKQLRDQKVGSHAMVVPRGRVIRSTMAAAQRRISQPMPPAGPELHNILFTGATHAQHVGDLPKHFPQRSGDTVDTDGAGSTPMGGSFEEDWAKAALTSGGLELCLVIKLPKQNTCAGNLPAMSQSFEL